MKSNMSGKAKKGMPPMRKKLGGDLLSTVGKYVGDWVQSALGFKKGGKIPKIPKKLEMMLQKMKN
jgi:hypothetical protein